VTYASALELQPSCITISHILRTRWFRNPKAQFCSVTNRASSSGLIWNKLMQVVNLVSALQKTKLLF